MPYKDPKVRKEKHKEYSRKDYLGKYAQRRADLGKRRKELKDEWIKFKSTLCCARCGFKNPAALDFHHENPADKEHNVNRLVSDGRFRKAYEEVKKCIVLCSNCHRIHHDDKRKNPAL